MRIAIPVSLSMLRAAMWTPFGISRGAMAKAKALLWYAIACGVAVLAAPNTVNPMLSAGLALHVLYGPDVTMDGEIESVALPLPSLETSAVTTNCCRLPQGVAADRIDGIHTSHGEDVALLQASGGGGGPAIGDEAGAGLGGAVDERRPAQRSNGVRADVLIEHPVESESRPSARLVLLFDLGRGLNSPLAASTISTCMMVGVMTICRSSSSGVPESSSFAPARA